eukprot:scaffold112543_cov36-Phaeocystis_antarctica.AAC.2
MHPGLRGRDVLPQGEALGHDLDGGVPKGVDIHREGRLGQGVRIALRAVGRKDRMLPEHRLQPGRHQRWLLKSKLLKLIGELATL